MARGWFKMKISVIGAGSWGTAIAQVIASNGYQVLLYARNSEQKDSINKNNLNSIYFPEFKLSKKIKASDSLKEVVSYGDTVLLAVPTQANREILENICNMIEKEQIIVSTAKGIEARTFRRNSEIIEEYLDNPVVVLSGPSHAEEVIRALPTTAVAASKNKEAAQLIQKIMMSAKFRVYTNPDIAGVEIGGAIKNIIAIAAGISDGLGFGDNTKAALITRGLHEMSRLGVRMGGQLLTFAGLSGMGDLVVTCTSIYSRNRRFGIKIGEGLSLEEAMKEVKQTVEGVSTTMALYEWYHRGKYDFDIPITKQIYQVLFEGKNPLQAVEDLMLRGPKHEIEEVVKEINW